MTSGPIKKQFPIDFQWPTQDPFLFCAYHYDLYPSAHANLGPVESLAGRRLGQDFTVKNGYRMYHGKVVPGFPVHPHRGFETITLVRKGFVDHADSLGAAGRYGAGDVQWMTAGAGIQHSEMFPLLDQNADNHLELIQIWINLPRKRKMTPPGFKMFWGETIPKGEEKGQFIVDVIAGDFNGTKALPPPSASWAHEAENEVAVWVITVEPKGKLTLPASKKSVSRVLYFYKGEKLKCEQTEITVMSALDLDSTKSCALENTSSKPAQFLILQGKPIQEPVAQHGPFVMNSQGEIMQAIQDYQKTQFGGWPWDRNDMVHGNKKERFGQHANGKKEFP